MMPASYNLNPSADPFTSRVLLAVAVATLLLEAWTATRQPVAPPAVDVGICWEVCGGRVHAWSPQGCTCWWLTP